MITTWITSQNWKKNSNVTCLGIDGTPHFKGLDLEWLLWMKACHVYCICWNLSMLWWSLHKRFFVCDYIAIVKIYQVDMYKMNSDLHNSFKPKFFLKVTQMFNANTSCKITQDWVIGLNDGIEHLTFCIIG
jgi:hypothetical protein